MNSVPYLCFLLDPAPSEVINGWGYAKVDGMWYEIYSTFKCGVRSKLTICETFANNGSTCHVRKKCDPYLDVHFKSVWASPKYPSSTGSYKKFGIANAGGGVKPETPEWFVDQALSMRNGRLNDYFTDRCQTRCAWY